MILKRLQCELVLVCTLAVVAWVGAACFDNSVSPSEMPGDSGTIQRAILAAPAGATVFIPAGTYTLDYSVTLKDRVSVKGAGSGQTILTMPPQSARNWIMYGKNLSNVTISGITFRASGYADKVNGIYMPGAVNCRASDLRFEGLGDGFKLGSGDIGKGWVISDIVARNCRMPMYISHVHDSSFSRLDLQGLRIAGDTLHHALYVERENRRLTFTDCTLSGGSGYTLHLWIELFGSSSDITFTNLTVDATNGRYPMVIGPRFSNIRFQQSTLKAGPTSEVVRFYGGGDITFDGFTASGGSVLALVDGSVSNVVFRNGTYAGTNLGSGVTFENVKTVSTTSTTLASSKTTTAAPTTTTVLRPTTTMFHTPRVTREAAMSASVSIQMRP